MKQAAPLVDWMTENAGRVYLHGKVRLDNGEDVDGNVIRREDFIGSGFAPSHKFIEKRNGRATAIVNVGETRSVRLAHFARMNWPGNRPYLTPRP